MIKISIVVFPGSNCDRDVKVAVERILGQNPKMVWHAEPDVPPSDLIILPGGFSFGDYLRCGAMAAHSPIMKDVCLKARNGTPVLGICNGFQILCESGLLPGVLLKNKSLKFICQDVFLRVERNDTFFCHAYRQHEIIKMPIAHAEGNYYADDETIKLLEMEGRIAFRYCNTSGNINPDTSPNGSKNNIAGITDKSGRILGLMPHPERLYEQVLGGTDGRRIFESCLTAFVAAQ